MKSLLVFLTLCFAAITYAQTAPQEPKAQTKLQAFIAKKGSMIIKDFGTMGSYEGKYGTKLEVKTLHLYAPGDEGGLRGLTIEVTADRGQETSFLDADEAEGLSKALFYLIDLSAKWAATPREYTETIYSTKDDLELGFYQQDSKQVAFVQSGRIAEKTCFLNSLADLSQLKGIIDKAIAAIRTK